MSASHRVDEEYKCDSNEYQQAMGATHLLRCHTPTYSWYNGMKRTCKGPVQELRRSDAGAHLRKGDTPGRQGRHLYRDTLRYTTALASAGTGVVRRGATRCAEVLHGAWCAEVLHGAACRQNFTATVLYVCDIFFTGLTQLPWITRPSLNTALPCPSRFPSAHCPVYVSPLPYEYVPCEARVLHGRSMHEHEHEHQHQHHKVSIKGYSHLGTRYTRHTRHTLTPHTRYTRHTRHTLTTHTKRMHSNGCTTNTCWHHVNGAPPRAHARARARARAERQEQQGCDIRSRERRLRCCILQSMCCLRR